MISHIMYQNIVLTFPVFEQVTVRSEKGVLKP